MGGYLAGSAVLCDFIRSFASGFIFTTALPLALAAGALTSVRHLRQSDLERRRQKASVAALRARLDVLRIPHLDNPSRIVPVLVGDPFKAKFLGDTLLDQYGIYAQPINHPTVPKGTEGLRITPRPQHSAADIDTWAPRCLTSGRNAPSAGRLREAIGGLCWALSGCRAPE